MYLQPARIEAILPGYPADCRAALKWLANYCLTRCDSSHKILAAHSGEAGAQRSFATFYALFKGTYNLSGEQARRQFMEVVTKLKAYDAKNNAESERLFYRSDAYDEFENVVLSRRKSFIKNRLVMISGPTGSGKTEMVDEFIARNGQDLSIRKVDSPQRASLYDFMAACCISLGIGMRGLLEFKAEEVIENVRTLDILFIDDAHRLYREALASNQTVWNFIQRLHDQTKTVIVTPVTDVFVQDIESISYFHQFFGRMGGKANIIRLPHHPEDEHIIGVCEVYGLKNAEKYLTEVRHAAHGVERLRPLQDALAFARAANDGPFTIDDLLEFLPPKPAGLTDAEQVKAKRKGGRS